MALLLQAQAGEGAYAEYGREVATTADLVGLVMPSDEYEIRKGLKGWSVRVWFEDDWCDR